MRKNIFLILLTAFFLSGCGGGSENTTAPNNSTTPSNPTAIASEPYYYQQWYLDYNQSFYTQNDIDPNANIHPSNFLTLYSGKGVTIAVIDDGLDTSHKDLAGSIRQTYDIATHSTDVSPSDTTSYHGTAVTGIIAANINNKGIAGIASNAKIIFLKYKENMSDSETIELFNKAQQYGADIINCSWGTYNVSRAVKEKIQDLAINGRDAKGIPIVFAAGNDDQDMGNDESAIPEVIAVGSTNKYNLKAWYSNHGVNLDVVAPGGYSIGITTLDVMGANGVSSSDPNYLLYDDPNGFIGTSASAPIVTAIIALMLEKDPNLTRAQIENLLHNTSDKIGEYSYNNGFNIYYGYGKVNLQRLLSAI